MNMILETHLLLTMKSVPIKMRRIPSRPFMITKDQLLTANQSVEQFTTQFTTLNMRIVVKHPMRSLVIQNMRHPMRQPMKMTAGQSTMRSVRQPSQPLTSRGVLLLMRKIAR